MSQKNLKTRKMPSTKAGMSPRLLTGKWISAI